ncbi:hypothetical protein MSWAN_1645 [Methanobacterium paludis]|uniref:Uncharacterized protein n=2 Tax=Methanobacterium paludis (strain DSM 25820 / JCM 18151 / SWAN1) TaxID=868131 RepID=F6D2S7_METPW|nr:hypothetical protein MSWAN_1645 [Methanobacterium paludis]
MVIMMCTDKEILQKFNIIEEYIHEEHPHCEVQRAKGAHELIIKEPLPCEGVEVYQDYKGLAATLKNHFNCIKVEEKPGLILITI